MLKLQVTKSVLLSMLLVSGPSWAQEAKPVEAAPAAKEATPAPAPAAQPAQPASATPAAAAPEARNIRFQFDGMSYADVLQRFAQMANKALISETNIDGTLTFNDPKPYSYKEALDTLNIILSMKDTMLVESDRFLRVVPFKQIPQMPLPIFRGLDRTGNVRPAEIVTVVLELKNLDAAEVAKAAAAMLSNAGSIASLTRGRGLIITDRLANIKRIKDLMVEIDTASPVQRQMKTYTLLNASGAVVSDLINKTFGSVTAPKRTIWNETGKKFDILPPDPEDYVTGVFDEPSRTLVLYGPADRVAMAEDLIKRFEDKNGGKGGEIKIFFPRVTKVDDLAKMIRQAIPGVAADNESPTAVSTKARVIVDAPMNRLIITAPIPGQLESIENLINRVERSGGGESPETPSEIVQVTKVFHIQSADPATVSKVLTNAFTKRAANGDLVSIVKATTDLTTKTVVVTGSPGDVQHAVSIVEQLDSGQQTWGPQQTRFIEFPSAAELKRVMPLIKQLYENQVQDGTRTGVAHAKFLPDPDSKRLIVTANEEHLKIVDLIATQLRTPAIAIQPRQFRAILLKNTKIDAVLKSVTDLVGERMNDDLYKEVPKPLILADAPNNRILVTANATQLREIESIVAAVDVAPARAQRVVNLIELKSQTAAQVIPLLTQFLKPLGESHTDPGARPEVAPDNTGKQLVVTSMPEDLEKIKAMVVALDVQPTRPQRVVNLVDLKTQTAAQILPLLNQFLKPLVESHLDTNARPEIVADNSGKKLVVTSVPEDLEKIRSMVATLDVAQAREQRQVSIIELKSQTATQILPLLTQLLKPINESHLDPAAKPEVIPDNSGKQLIVTSVPEDLDKIKTLVRQLEGKGDAPSRSFKAFKIFGRPPAEVSVLAEQLYKEQIKGQPEPSGGPAAFVAEPKGSRILVSGAEQEIARAEAIIRQLDPAQAKTNRDETRVLRLKSALASELAGLVEKSLNTDEEQVKVLVDARSNSLVVTGPASAVEAASHIVQQLDATPNAQPREIRIVELKAAQARAVAPVVSDLFAELVRDQRGSNYVSQTRIVADTNSNRLIITGVKDELAQINALVEKLDQSPAVSDGARVFKINSASAAEIAKIISSTMITYDARNQPIQRISVSADEKSNSVVVSGSRQDLQDVALIVEKLDGEGRSKSRELKVVELQGEDPAKLVALASQIWAAQSQGRTPGTEVSLTLEPSGRRVIILAPRADLPQVEQVLLALDQKPDGEVRTLHVVELKQPAKRLLPMLTRAYEEQEKGRKVKPATIMPDGSTNRLLVFGSDAQVATIQEILVKLESQNGVFTRQTKSFDLGNMEALDRVLPMVKQLYTDQLQNIPDAGPADAQFLTDTKNARLIVSARQDHLAQIEIILKGIGTEKAAPVLRETKMFEVGNPEDVQRLVPLVQQLYKEQMRGNDVSDPADAQILGDERGGQIIVTGRPGHVAQIEAIVTKLVSAKLPPKQRETRIYNLNTSTAAELVVTVKALYAEELKKHPNIPASQVLILPDGISNRLIVSGLLEEVEIVEGLVMKLDEVSPQPGGARFFKLKSADADQVSTVLSTALVQLDRTNGRSVPRISIGIDKVGNTLVVSGDPKDLSAAASIIEQLDGAAEKQPRQMRILTVKSGRAAELSLRVKQLYTDQLKGQTGLGAPDALILGDAASDRLIVAATEPQLALIEKLVGQLDEIGADGIRQLRLIPLKNNPVASVTTLVSQLFATQIASTDPGQRLVVTPAPDNRTLLVEGPKNIADRVEALVQTLEQSQGATQGRETKFFDVGVQELTRVQTLARQLYEAELKGQGSAETPDALMVPDLPTGRLIVTAKPEHLKMIEGVIARLLPKIESGAARETRLVPVGQAEDVQRILPILQQLYREQLKGKEATDPADAQILPDDRAGRLIVTARPSHHLILEKLLAQLGANQSAGKARDTRIYDLTTTTATELATTVKTLYAEESKSSPGVVSSALILPDPVANRLIVTGSVDELTRIESIVQRLDKVSPQTAGTRVFKLKSANAEQVSTVLSTSLTTLERNSGRSIPRVSVGADTNSNSLVVSGEAKDLNAAATIIEQLDETTETAHRQIRILSVKAGQAPTLSQRVKQLYQEQVKGQTRKNVSDPLIMADGANDKLIITATADQFLVIEDLVAQLQELNSNVERQLRIIPLKNNSAASLSTILTQLFSKEVQAQSQANKLMIAPAPDDRTIIAEATPTLLKKVDEVVQTLDSRQMEEAFQVRSYVVTQGNPTELATALTRLFSERRSPKDNSPQPRFEADAASNTLLVGASPDHFVQITKLIEELQAGVRFSNEIRTFRLQNSDADQIAGLVGSMLGVVPQGKGNKGQRPVGSDPNRITIAPAPALNAVVVQGPPAALTTAEQLIKTLDNPEGLGKSVIQTVRLKKAAAESLAEAVNKAILARNPLTNAPKATVTPVANSNSLLIHGPPDAVKDVMNIVHELDEESSGGDVEIRVYKLENGQAKELSTLLNQLLQDVLRASTRSGRSSSKTTAHISADHRTNSLIVSAPSEQFKFIEQLLLTLDQTPAKSDKIVHFIFLKNAKALDVSNKIELLYEDRPSEERPKVDFDSFSNSLTVFAKKTDIKDIDELVAKLDSSSRDTSIQVRMVVIDRIPAEQMATMLKGLYSQMSSHEIQLVDKLPPVKPAADRQESPPGPDQEQPGEPKEPKAPAVINLAVDKAANAVLLSGPPQELDKINRLIDELTFASAGSDAEFRQFPLKEADPVAVAKMLAELFKPEPIKVPAPKAGEPTLVTPAPRMTVVAELRTRSIIVRAKPTDFVLLQGLLDQIDVKGLNAQLAFRLVPVLEADPQKLLPLVTQMVTQLGLSRPGEPVTVTPDLRTRSFFIVARESMMKQVEDVIHSLDTPPAFAEAEVVMISLRHTAASQLATVLQNMLKPAATGEATTQGRELQEQIRSLRIRNDAGKEVVLDLAKPIKIMADSGAGSAKSGNRLIISSTADNLKALAAVVEMMDTVAVTEGVVFKIVKLVHADASPIAETLTTIFAQGQKLAVGPNGAALPEGEAGKALASGLNVAPDKRANSLILSGKPESVALAQKIIAELDNELGLEFSRFRFFPLKNADATGVASVLQRILDARAAQQGQGPQAMKSLVIADPRSNSLIVAGSNDIFELVGHLVTQLDTSGPSLSGQIRFVTLKNANASVISTALNTLFTQRYQALKTPDSQRNAPIIIPDPRSNGLMVVAGIEDGKALDELLAKLDQKPENPAITLTVIPLRHNDSVRMAESLQRIMLGYVRSLTVPGQNIAPQDRVTVDSDILSNSLIVSANKENLEHIKELLGKLDVETTAGGIIQTFTLQFADAQRAATMLRNLVRQGLYRPGSGSAADALRARESMAVAVDVRSNTLIVSAGPDTIQVVKEVIKLIDTKDFSDGGNIQLYTLKNARASQLAATLEQFFRSKRTGDALATDSDRTPPVTVIPDDRTNTLIITGGKESFASIDRMIAQLDGPEVFDKTHFRVYPLKHTTAGKLQSTLQKLFLNRPSRFTGRPAEPITVVEDKWANSLIVAASNEDLQMVSSLIESLDSTQSDGVEVHVIPLTKADARNVALTVQGLYRDGGPGTTSSVAINVDERLNALVVSAGEADFKRISELVRKLDTDTVGRIAEIRIFPLQHANADELSVILTTVLTSKAPLVTSESPNRQSMLQFVTRTPEGEQLVASALKESVLITSDRRRNALVVSAPVESMNLLAKIIENLDTESPQTAQIKVFKLENADSRQMAEVLSSLFRLKQVGPSVGGQRAIQYTMAKSPVAAELEGEGDVSATIGSAEEQALTVTVDLRTNSLLIGGSEHYVALASNIIQQLDSSPAQERKTEVYRLRNSQAKEMESALSRFLDQDKSKVTQVLGGAAVGTAQRLLDHEVAIVAEPVSNTLLLSASPRYFEQFKALIEELDQPQPQVLIQVLLAEVTLDKDTEMGVEWAVASVDKKTRLSTGTDLGVAQDLKNFGGYSSSVTGSDYSFLLRALESDGRLEVLSRPQILTADNQPATIDIGQRVPLITDSRVTDVGNVINSFRYENVGVSLSVTPRISPDGFVKMEVAPIISAISSSNVEVSKGVTSPIINQRKATTTVSVQSGQSIIIGGLISTTDDTRVKKVPYLGSIPYLGALFRNSKTIQDRKELLIILTPQLLLGPEDTRRLTKDQLHRSTIKDQIKRDKLQQEALEPILPFFDADPSTGTNKILKPKIVK